jgi:uncharacterized protein (TIGR02145 family)
VIAQTTTASSGGNITYNGGSNITARGVVWNTTGIPTITDNKTTDGFGTGLFFSNMTDLSPNTTYYVRAYATNSIGTEYGNQQTFNTTQQAVTDIDGNTYNSFQIGTQVWMSENLKTSRYRNGGSIPYVVGNSDWQALTTGAWSYYENDDANNSIYGKLYNWFATQGDTICPTGWHVPTGAEWHILADYLGGYNVAGGKMKSVGTAYWQSPNTGATNESGLSIFPGGLRFGSQGGYYYKGTYAFIWTASGGSQNVRFDFNGSKMNDNSFDRNFGASIRCLKDL